MADYNKRFLDGQYKNSKKKTNLSIISLKISNNTKLYLPN